MFPFSCVTFLMARCPWTAVFTSVMLSAMSCACNVTHDIMPYLLTLAITHDPISVATPKVSKASTIVSVMCRCRQCYRLKYNTNVN
jgi:hypothetical protein